LNKISFRTFAALVLTVAASGCFNARGDAMVPADFAVERRYDGSVKIEVTGGDERLLNGAAVVPTQEFERALVEAIEKSGIFTNVSSSADYLLRVRIVAIVPPAVGLQQVASMSARWTATSLRDDSVVFDDVILSRYAANVGNALAYGDRVMLEGVARQNVKSGIEALSKAGPAVTAR
jgi:hypothetical protein